MPEHDPDVPAADPDLLANELQEQPAELGLVHLLVALGVVTHEDLGEVRVEALDVFAELLAELEVDLSISELDIAKVFKGQACTVRAEAYANRNYTGFVSRIMPTADRAKASVSVRVKIDVPRGEAGQYLRPDMGARVTFYNKKAS